jgi:Zn finger protein HypA/HybF involved in hydrogenase expression
MAIVKLNYLKAKDPQNRAKIKETIHYISHRLNKEGQSVTRALCSHEGEIDKKQAYEMIEKAGETRYFYRIIISPDPIVEDVKTDLDLWRLTQQTILKLEERLSQQVQCVASEHTDQNEIRHVHAIALLPGKLNVSDLKALRMAATELATPSRAERVPEQGVALGYAKLDREPYPASQAHARPFHNGGITCPVCINQTMHKVAENVYRCPNCYLVLGLGRGLERRSDLQLEIS